MYCGQIIIRLHIPIHCAMKQDSLIIRVSLMLWSVFWRRMQPSGSPTGECPIKSSALRRSSAGGQSEVNWFLQIVSLSIFFKFLLTYYTQISLEKKKLFIFIHINQVLVVRQNDQVLYVSSITRPWDIYGEDTMDILPSFLPLKIIYIKPWPYHEK